LGLGGWERGPVFAIQYWVYTQKNVFPSKSMKAKELFWRYPRKISLLKDLRWGYPGASVLRKYMKTGRRLGIPSKTSLLKDLAGAVSEES
jgi:hypothetical protein